MVKPAGISQTRTLRGGRIIRHKGQVASFAPQLGAFSQIIGRAFTSLAGSVSPVALFPTFKWVATGVTRTVSAGAITAAVAAAIAVPALVVTTSGAALADDACNIAISGGGVTEVVCSDGGAPASDEQFFDTSGSGDKLIVNVLDGFAVDAETNTSGNLQINGFQLSSDNGIFFEQSSDNPGVIQGATDGIDARNDGTGNIEITTIGLVEGRGAIGIFADSEGGTDVILNVADVIGATNGIRARTTGTGSIDITATGNVEGRGIRGIFVQNNGTGYTNITISGVVRGSLRAIEVRSEAEVTLELQPGAATVGETLIKNTRNELRTGASLVFGGDDTSQNGTFDLALWDDGTGTPDNSGNEFFGFDPVLLKKDASTFVLTDSNGDGDDTTSVELEKASITGGTLALDRGAFDDMTIQMAGPDAFTIEEEGTLAVYSDSDDGSGFGRIEGSLNNYGTIDLSTFDMGAGTRFEVTDNYGVGSSLIMDTTLDGDASPTDMLIVGGDTSGTTDVTFNVLSGAGAVTDTGIQIVDVDSNSNGSFVIANPDARVDGIGDILIAGAYGYRLTRGDDVGDDASSDWFLKSTQDDNAPIYQPAAPAYESLPAAMATLNSLPTLQQRAGNRYWDSDETVMMAEDASSEGSATVEQNAVWLRIEVAHASVEPDQSTSSTSYDVNMWQARLGVDAGVIETEDGKLVAGVNFAYGQSSLDASSFFGDSDIDTDGYSLAGTLTWYGNNGFYADAQAQYSWFGNDLSSDAVGTLTSGLDGNGTAVSLEVGQRIQRSETLTFTPQAQLVWSSVDFDSFDGPNGGSVSLGDGDSFKGRIGLAAEHASSWQGENGMTSRASFYGIANINHEFLDGTSVNVSGVSFRSEQDAWTGDIGVGGTYNWNDDKYSLFGETSYGTSLSNLGDSYALKGNAGLRVKW